MDSNTNPKWFYFGKTRVAETSPIHAVRRVFVNIATTFHTPQRASMIYLLLYLLTTTILGQGMNTINLANTDYKDSIIDCEEDQPCMVQCESDQSCQNATINCPSDSYCVIQCYGYLSCSGAIINANPQSTISHVVCIGNSSCSNAIIHGGIESTLYLYCQSPDSCRDSVIDAALTSQLKMFGCTAPGSCWDLTLICPPNIDGIPYCEVTRMLLIYNILFSIRLSYHLISDLNVFPMYFQNPRSLVDI